MFVVITSGRHDDRTRGHWAVQPMLVTRVIEAFDGAGPNVDPFDATAVVVARGQPGRSPCRNSPRCALPSCSSRGPPGCRHRWTASASASARRQRAAGLAGRPQPSQRIWRQALHSRAPGEHGEPGLQPERARTALGPRRARRLRGQRRQGGRSRRPDDQSASGRTGPANSGPVNGLDGRGGGIRTRDLLVPKQQGQVAMARITDRSL